MATYEFPFSGKSILLVEDNVDNRLLMVDMMEYMGLKMDIANDGEEAVEKWKNSDYDLIIMDIQMPKMNGYQAAEVIRKLEKEGERVPILALTASALTSDRDKCFTSGMNDYLSKPINIDMLEKKLCQLFTSLKNGQ